MNNIDFNNLKSKQNDLEFLKNQNEGDKHLNKENEFKKTIFHQYLDHDGRERLNRVRIVNPEHTEKVEQFILKNISLGLINQKISDNEIIRLLDKFSQENMKKNPKIIHSRKYSIEDEELLFKKSNLHENKKIDDDDIDDFFD